MSAEAAWDAAVDEAEACGWISGGQFAVDDVKGRNPYREPAVKLNDKETTMATENEIEAAAKAIYAVDHPTRDWDTETSAVKHGYKRRARVALEAVAPKQDNDGWRHAERLAAALALVLYEAHPHFGSTAKWHGGIGGQMITWHCSLTQGAAPGTEWAEHDLPSKPLREFLATHPFDFESAKDELRNELAAMLDPKDNS